MRGNGNKPNGQHLRAVLHSSQTHAADRCAGANEFDWDEARERIARAVASLSGAEETPEVVAALLERRTAQLAQAIEKAELEELVDLVLVQLGCEVYGLEAQYVIDMRPVERVTRVPRVPAWVTGVVNWRGHVISVLDLRRWWDLPQPEALGGTGETVPYLVMVETSDLSVALLVDNVLAVETVPWHAVQEVGGTVRRLRAEYVRGIVEREQAQGHMAVVLDLATVLADPQLIIHEEIV